MSRWPSDDATPRSSSAGVAVRTLAAGATETTSSRPIISRTTSARVIPVSGWLSHALRPSRSTVTCVQRSNTSSSLWLTKRMETPSAASRRSTANSVPVSCGVSDEVGSSSSRNRDSSDSAFAISTSCICATLSRDTGVRGSRSRCSSSSQRRVPATAAASSNMPSRVGGSSKVMFSATEKRVIRLRSWCTTPMPAAIASRGVGKCRAVPSSSTSPASG